MHVLVIGSGGREHALCWKIAQSPLLETLYVAPGNPGMESIATAVTLNVANHQDVIRFCKEKQIGLVVIGPEAPLVAGLADDLTSAGIPVFGPTKQGAELEASKAFTKKLCDDYHIPTAAYGTFTDAEAAKQFLATSSLPIVVKADGLAAGKGVVIAATQKEAEAAIDDMFAGAFGAAGNKVVIEEFLEGEELSFFALSDGNTVIPFASAQDHKRVGEGDTGPNTGGMGTYSPAPLCTDALQATIMQTIIEPTLKGLAAQGITYRGMLFAGLMLTKKGPQLLEYNARFGDPETQSMLARLDSDLLPLLLACATGTLHTQPPLRFKPVSAMCVVMAARGYPGNYEKGTEIRKLHEASALQHVVIFHAGTERKNGKIVANGGRVLGVTAIGDNLVAAKEAAYNAVDMIDWPEGFCRRDIGWRALKR